MTSHPPALVRAVADAIVAVAKRYPVPSDPLAHLQRRQFLGAGVEQLAAAALDAADTWRRARTVADHRDALRLVEDILDAHLVNVGDGRELDAATGPAIVDALIGDPVVTERRDDAGDVVEWTMAWPSDDTQACIVARPVLKQIVAELNRVRAGTGVSPTDSRDRATSDHPHGYARRP